MMGFRSSGTSSDSRASSDKCTLGCHEEEEKTLHVSNGMDGRKSSRKSSQGLEFYGSYDLDAKCVTALALAILP